jgi:hypothetical protein
VPAGSSTVLVADRFAGWKDGLRARLPHLLAFLLFYVAAVALQWAGGAYQAEFGANPDEAAHYVTGLMVRDYIAALAPEQPMDYARNYYLHYPKVALGHWPPVFYVVQSLWTLPFSAARPSLLLLMAALTALVAGSLYGVLRVQFPAPAAVAAGLLMVSLPLAQELGRAVMAETLTAVLVFQAVLWFGRYLDRPGWKPAAWFGLWSSLAILTKGTGFALALVPGISVLASGQFRLLKRFSFWLPALVVLALCGPWYFWVPGAQHESVARFGHPWFRLFSLTHTPRGWVQVVGVALAPLVALGLLKWFLDLVRKREIGGVWTAAAALLASLAIFRFLIHAAADLRHHILAVPALLMFLAAGMAWVLAWGPLGRVSARRKTVVLAVALGALVWWYAYHTPRKPRYGYAEVASELVARPELRNSVLLVSSDALGEGMLISEVAMREKRPGHIVLRASKMLFRSSWTGEEYRPLYQTPAELLRFLEDTPVGILVIDLSAPVQQHQRLLLEVVNSHPERWKLLASYPQGAGRPEAWRQVRVYRLAGHEGRPVGKIRMDLRSRITTFAEN